MIFAHRANTGEHNASSSPPLEGKILFKIAKAQPLVEYIFKLV